MDWLPPAFFGTALLYASVGFGGGSTYNALLALAGFDFRLLPIVSLCCNVVVVTGSTIRFARAGEMPWKRALVLSLIAAPLAFLGGLTPIREATFLFLLGLSLVAAGLGVTVYPESLIGFLGRNVEVRQLDPGRGHHKDRRLHTGPRRR